MNIVRKFKLNKLGYYQSTLEEIKLFEYIENNLTNLTEVKLQEYPDSIFYFKNNKCIFEYELYFENRLFMNERYFRELYDYYLEDYLEIDKLSLFLINLKNINIDVGYINSETYFNNIESYYNM